MGWDSYGRNGNSYGYVNLSNQTQKINYQLVDNNFPDNTAKFQEEIEKIFLVKGTKFIQKRAGSKNRFIEIEIPERCTTEEILNLGKRVSIIEQEIIVKCKGLIDNTVTRAITSQQLNNLNLIHNKMEPHFKSKFTDMDSDTITDIFGYLKKVIATINTRQKNIKKPQ